MRTREEIFAESFATYEWGPEKERYLLFRAQLEVMLDCRELLMQLKYPALFKEQSDAEAKA